MSKENCKQRENEVTSVIEDLTLSEIEAEDVKGGPSFVAGYFRFGVEREMKESGEKGGTE